MVKLSALALLTSLLATTAAQASTWDLQRDFSTATNPMGAWTLGYSDANGASFTPFVKLYPLSATGAYYGEQGGMVSWGGAQYTSSQGGPIVGKVYGQPSIDISIYELPPSSRAAKVIVKQKSDGIIVHPGSLYQPVARWKAPMTGMYYIDMIASNADMLVGATVAISVKRNGTALYSSTMSGLTGLRTFKTPETGISLNAGDLIDISIGSNGPFQYDSTGLDVMIKTINVAQ